MRALGLVVLLGVGPAGAVENAGTTAAPILQMPLGSRALGMGSAFTAVASDISALYYNPAGLSRLNAHEAALSFMSGLSDDKVQHMAYGAPLPLSGISGNGYAALGTSLLFSQSGTIEVNTLNSDGSLKDSRTISAGSDFVWSLGYAERVGTSPLELRDGRSYGINHFLGASGKLVRSTLVEQYKAQTMTADVGYLINSPEAGLTVGFAALNLGGKLRYSGYDEPLPTIMRAGAAYQASVPGVHSYTLSTDASYVAREELLRVNAGAEYFWLRTYGVRMGYQVLSDALGMTIGFGFRWNSRVLIDYAWGMGRTLNDAHRFTLTYRFGGVAPATRARQRRPFIERSPEREVFENLNERTPETYDRPAPPRGSPRRERTGGAPGWIY